MAIPSATDAVWEKLLTGRIHCRLESLAIKIFLGSAKLQLTRDSSFETQRRLAQELHNVFSKNATLQSVQNDLTRLAG
jgi:hypothetical protein